jgi:DNA-binding IclR family transcriptional regulator
VDTGSHHPAADTTSGRLLIALQSPADQARHKGDLPAAELKRIASAGHNVAHHRTVHGVHDLAVPVRLANGHAALALAALDSSAQSDRILSFLPALRQTAFAIERALGLTNLPKTP